MKQPNASRRLLLAMGAICAVAARSHAADATAAALASIRAVDAGRHVATLADDAFEGREGGSRGGRAAASYIVEQLERLGLEPAGDGGSFYQSFGGMRNVLALLPGSDPERSRELIVVGGHYDHVGYGNSRTSYGPFGFVHNGADDNASGVAGLLEIAEAFVQLPSRPRRSILFAFWDGEEKGLLGSSHFLRQRPAPLAGRPLVFAVNLDMIGRLRGRRVEAYGTRSSTGMRAAVVDANNDPANAAELELTFLWDLEDDSDHYPFIMAGVPTLMLHTGLHDQYHRPSDDVHLVNLDGIEPVARLTFGLVAALADDPAPGPSFRTACRQESDANRRSLEAPAAEPPGPRGRWGIGTRPDEAGPHPVVVRVSIGGPAARAGMLPGDRIVAIDGQRVGDQTVMLERFRTAGPVCAVDVERKGILRRLELGESLPPP